MSIETKLHSKVKPRYHNEDKPADKGVIRHNLQSHAK